MRLQGVLLASDDGRETVRWALKLAGQFHGYLCELQSKVTAREYSEFASWLDIGAVGAVALESVLFGDEEKVWERLLVGGLGEAMMVGASRQYVKAWRAETGSLHVQAAWYLAEALWRTSVETRAELDPRARWQAVQSLLAPVYEEGRPGAEKAVLIVRVFQLLLLTYLARLFSELEDE
jgi:hypothetical protein